MLKVVGTDPNPAVAAELLESLGAQTNPRFVGTAGKLGSAGLVGGTVGSAAPVDSKENQD